MASQNCPRLWSRVSALPLALGWNTSGIRTGGDGNSIIACQIPAIQIRFLRLVSG